MAGILKSDMGVISAQQFMESLSSGSNKLYLTIGKSSSWSTESTPDTPSDDITTENTFRNNIIALKKIDFTDMRLIVPRVQYTSGNTYFKKGYSINSSNTEIYPAMPKRQTNYYCMNSEYNVYECISHTGTASTVEPVGIPSVKYNTSKAYSDSSNANAFISDTNNRWRFLFDLSNSVESGFLTDGWIPVPFGSTATTNQTSKGDLTANISLGAYRVMFNVSLEGTYNGIIPYTTAFRQFGLLYNPTTSDGTLLSNDVYAASSVDLTSGTVLFINNKVVTQREEGQIEQIKFIISF